MEWSIEVTTRREIEGNGKIVYSVYLRKALEESGLDEGVFWEKIRQDLTRKAQLKRLPQAAKNIENVVNQVLSDKQNVTPDLGGKATTEEMGQAICDGVRVL